MAVFRIDKTRDYTVMANFHLRDISLSLKAKGLLRRDPRMVERKKPGQPKARKRFQFSKR